MVQSKAKYAKRDVPLTVRARGILVKMKKASSSGYLFPATDGEQLSRNWASEQFRTRRDVMKLPDDCVVHSTRHTFCESGCDEFTIMHSSIVISQKYVHPTPALLENAIRKLTELNTKREEPDGAGHRT